jgi:hypothetical protein
MAKKKAKSAKRSLKKPKKLAATKTLAVDMFLKV